MCGEKGESFEIVQEHWAGNQKSSWLPHLALHLGSCRECQTMTWEPQTGFSFMSSELWGVTEVAQSRWDREVPLPESPPTHGPSAIWPEQLCFWSVSCVAFLSNILFKIPPFEKPFLQCFTTKLQDPKGSLSLFKKIFIYFFGCAK